MEQSPKRTIHWKCPQCNNQITLHVRVTHSPTCHNLASHSAKVVEMVRVKPKK
jgi:hypothetical protein